MKTTKCKDVYVIVCSVFASVTGNSQSSCFIWRNRKVVKVVRAARSYAIYSKILISRINRVATTPHGRAWYGQLACEYRMVASRRGLYLPGMTDQCVLSINATSFCSGLL